MVLEQEVGLDADKINVEKLDLRRSYEISWGWILRLN